MSYTVSISVAFISEIEVVSKASSLERCCTVNGKHDIIDIVFSALAVR